MFSCTCRRFGRASSTRVTSSSLIRKVDQERLANRANVPIITKRYDAKGTAVVGRVCTLQALFVGHESFPRGTTRTTASAVINVDWLRTRVSFTRDNAPLAYTHQLVPSLFSFISLSFMRSYIRPFFFSVDKNDEALALFLAPIRTCLLFVIHTSKGTTTTRDVESRQTISENVIDSRRNFINTRLLSKLCFSNSATDQLLGDFLHLLIMLKFSGRISSADDA